MINFEVQGNILPPRRFPSVYQSNMYLSALSNAVISLNIASTDPKILRIS